MMAGGPTALAVAQAVADGVRLDILHRLMEGPAAVSELVAALDAAQSKVSNHLAILREARLVDFEREGRKSIYRISGPSVAVLIESIQALSRRPDTSRPTAELARARTCYDHLAGSLGVALFDWLVREKALSQKNGEVTMGRKGQGVFEKLGVDLTEATRARRRFASGCLDWTEKKTHLGGSLGASLCDALVQRGWVQRQPRTRALIVTPAGRRQLRRLGALD